MSGPVPSPSMKGMMGLSGTTSLPSRRVILAPWAGGVSFRGTAVDIAWTPADLRSAGERWAPRRAGNAITAAVGDCANGHPLRRDTRAARWRVAAGVARMRKAGECATLRAMYETESGARQPAAKRSMLRQLLAVRPVQPREEAGAERLKQTLSAWSLMSIGIGATIGTGVFVLTGTVAANQSGPAITLSLLIAAFGSALAALCYAEFAAFLPVPGSAYSYTYATLGEAIAWFIGWNLLLEY